MAGVPVVALEWSDLRETYLAPDHGASSIGVDYLVTPRAHVDHVALRFDFDPLTLVDAMAFEGTCQLTFPIAPLIEAVPAGAEDVVAATVVASSASGTSRTGRVFVTTGTDAIEIRTDALDPGDPVDGSWWALFEPAAGNARLVIVPAVLDRSSFRMPGVPANQPGTIALIQTRALEYDAGTRTVYAPWGFARDWRRYARSWYGALVLQPSDGLVEVPAIVPPDADISSVHRGDGSPALTDGAMRAFRVLSSGEDESTIAIACEVSVVEIHVLSFIELTVGESPEALGPGGTMSVDGACETGAASWPLTLHSRSMNGRAGALLLRRSSEVSP